MNAEIIRIAGQIAGIGGLAIGALLLVFRDVIRKEIFPNLTREHGYKIIRLIIVLTFFIALAGIAAWGWVQTRESALPDPRKEPSANIGQFRRIYYQGFQFSEDNATAVAQARREGWLIGKSGDWEGHVSDGKYRLCNVSGSESASYTARMSHEVSDKKTSLRDAMVSVRVRVEPPNGTYSGAGILFRKSADKSDYLSYMLQAGDTASLLRRREASLSVLSSHEVPSPDNGGFLTLRIEAKGPRLDLYAENKHVYPSSEEQQIDLLEGDPGIFAYSTGCFVFDDFAIYERTK
jgi:hypothetical protein